MTDAWGSWFVVATGAFTAVGIEVAVMAHHRRRHRRHGPPDCEPIPWRELEHYR